MSSQFNEDFIGICYGMDEGLGNTCKVLPRGSSLEVYVATESGSKKLLVSLDYRSMEVSLSGVNDKYICFSSYHRDKKINLLVTDRDIIKQIEALGAPRQLLEKLRAMSFTSKKRTAGKWTIGAIIVSVLVCLAIAIWFGFGLAMAVVVDVIPTKWEVDLGRTTAKQIVSEKEVCADPELNRAVQEIGMRLVHGLGTSPYEFKLRILDDPQVNAFALPGGYVFINRGLIEQAQDGNEVAGVLAHEVQHVLGRHGMNNVVRQAGIMLIVAALIGDAGGLESFIIDNAANLAAMSFSREQEIDADSGGLELMYNANLDVSGLPRFLEKLAAKEGSLSGMITLFSTHPASSNRVEELNSKINAKKQTNIIGLKSNWDEIKNSCTPVSISDPDAVL